MDTQRFYGRQQVAAMLDMEVRQLRDLIERGLLPRGIRRGKRLMWSREDVDAMVWLEIHRQRLRVSRPKPASKKIIGDG